MASFDLICATCSVPREEPEGEDRVRAFGHGSGASGVVVCDGVGSIEGSGERAEEVSDLAVALMSGKRVSAVMALDFELARNVSSGGGGATTVALVCADGAGAVGHFLLGNGAILELIPLEQEPGKVRLLWASIALPQMAGAEGRPALRSFLPSDGRRVEAEKGMRWATPATPRLYLVCSDGFLSEEDRLEGPAPDGTVWRQVPRLAANLLQRLTSSWTDLVAGETGEEETSAALSALIEQSINEGEGPDDDTTVGALLLRPVRAGREVEA